MKYFSADHHFGHNRVLDFCKDTRKFQSIEDHDNALISAHNRVVGPDDEWYCLGDFSFHREARDTRKCFYAMNGKHKTLIVGNHEKQDVLHLPWDDVLTYHEFMHEKLRFCLFHYPIKEGQWNGAHHGSIHLFGHVHGQPQYNIPVRALDVGVDSIGFTPISINEIVKKMSKINKFVPHHKVRNEDAANK